MARLAWQGLADVRVDRAPTPGNDIVAATVNKVIQDYRSAIFAEMTADGSGALFWRPIDKPVPRNDPQQPGAALGKIRTRSPTTLRDALQPNIASTQNDVKILPKGRCSHKRSSAGAVLGKDYNDVIFPPASVQDSGTAQKAWLK